MSQVSHAYWGRSTYDRGVASVPRQQHTGPPPWSPSPTMDPMPLLPHDLYATIDASVPIVCADFVPVRRDAAGTLTHLGLIRRSSPFGEVWCHLGGRVWRGETLAQAIERHLADSLTGLTLGLAPDPQPDYVYQWFPDDIAPPAATKAGTTALSYGRDPRKHAIGLTFVLDAAGEAAVRPGGEALDFAFHPIDSLPNPLWPGCDQLFDKLITAPRQ